MKGLATLLIYCVALFGGAISAQDAPLWLRYPMISPNGETIAFSYKGDLYRVSSSGGTAQPLTLYDGHDFMPVWSHDGQWIAFASDRFGNFDVYLMPAQGGQARRLTFHSASDFPSGFHPDDGEVLFTSARKDAASSSQFPANALPELYAIDTKGGRPRLVSTIPAEEAKYDGAGGRIVYHDRKGYEDHWRKHHTSSVTRDVWIYEIEPERYTKLTAFEGEDLSPVFSPDDRHVYYLSEAGGTFNVFRRPTDGSAEPEQLTRFETHPVRFLSIAQNGTLCLTHRGEVYLIPPGEEPRKVAIAIFADDQNRAEEIHTVTGNITEMAVSPSGKEIALVVRGEIFATSLETDITKRITNTPEQERSIDFSPDGRSLIYAAERKGSWNLYRTSLTREKESLFFQATVLKEEPLLETDRETFQPSFSPDGKEVAYLEDRNSLKVLNLDSGTTRTILPGSMTYSYADGDQYYEWSPDGKWFLAEFLQPNYWIQEVGLIPADGNGEPFNLTESGYFDSQPKWMMNGKMTIWESNRDGLQGHAKTGPTQGDIYALFFTQAAFDRFKLTQEEYDLLKEKEEEEKEQEKGKEEEKKKKDDKKEQEKEKLPDIEIELDGIRDRRVRLTIHSARLADAVVGPKGEKLFYLAQFEKGYDLWVTELRTKETKILAKLGAEDGSLELDEKGETLFLLADGKLSKITVKSGDKKSIPVRGEMTLNTKAERSYFFEHAWRQVREKFYDPGLHGVDWESMKSEYSRFLPHINNNYDFAEMLSELLGELNASHTGATYRHTAKNADATGALGLFYDTSRSGNGLLILEVMDRNPIATKESRLAPGVIIEKIDGVEIAPDTNYHRLLNRKAGKYTLLSLHDPEKDERWETTVKPLTQAEERLLRYRRWVESRQQLANELSDGRVGYVHVRGMTDPSYRVVQEEVLGKHANREALVIDTRFNSGGDLVDDLSIFLSGEKYMDFVPPDRRTIGMEPTRRWTKASIVIANEGNYSDAHCFPWAYQHFGIGKVVGMPVPGTCTFVWWERLQDRSLVFGIPNMGIWDPSGVYLENLQLEPDVRVENEPEQIVAGRDQQLERAVEELLQELGSR